MSDRYLLPEWSTVRSVAIAWPFPDSDWQANYHAAEACYWQLLKALSCETEVWVCLHHSLSQETFQQTLATHRINPNQIHCLPNLAYDDTWIRDYGPLSLNDSYISLTFNGWGGKYPAEGDNNLYQSLEKLCGSPITKLDFVGEGGGIETNGSVLLVNDLCLVDDNRNSGLSREQVAERLIDMFGVEDIEWVHGVQLTGDDTDGHIDTIARFAATDSLVYAGPNAEHPDADALQSLHEQIQAICTRRDWRAIALPSPVYQSQIDRRLLPATYANFLIVNSKVFVPVYGLLSDVEALTLIQMAFPDHVIHPVRCEALLEQHGSLHCATMQICDIG